MVRKIVTVGVEGTAIKMYNFYRIARNFRGA